MSPDGDHPTRGTERRGEVLPVRPDPPESQYDYRSPMLELLGYVSWTVLAICGFATLVVAARLAMSYRHGDPGREVVGLLWVLAAVALVGSASAVVSGLLA